MLLPIVHAIELEQSQSASRFYWTLSTNPCVFNDTIFFGFTISLQGILIYRPFLMTERWVLRSPCSCMYLCVCVCVLISLCIYIQPWNTFAIFAKWVKDTKPLETSPFLQSPAICNTKCMDMSDARTCEVGGTLRLRNAGFLYRAYTNEWCGFNS
jgi:hypothetical protein